MSKPDFRQVAYDYCDLIDAVEMLPFTTFVSQVTQAIAALYTAALSLPDVAPATPADVAAVLGVDAKTALSERLGDIFASHNLYRLPAHPFVAQSDDDAVTYAGLGDDLADIYGDVKDGLAMESDNLATRHWRLSFRTHWAAHATSALWALDRYLHGQDRTL
jgi:hypothetical protein